jgi:ferric-dicitrate binding protein FerR (iron transport regulator)
MPTPPIRLRYLLQQYAADSCTRGELLELLRAIGEAGSDQELENSLQSIWQELTGSDVLPPIDKERVFSHIIGDPAFQVPARRRLWPRMAAAAAVLILALGTFAYFYRTDTSSQKMPLAARVKNDVGPGSNKAILTLADGSTIVLDSSHNGALGQQGNTKVIKLDSGRLAYQTAGGHEAQAAGQPLFNTIATPRGGQYQVVLPDGTKVWLNASSSLRFPTAFNKDKREVDLMGEAYFEVAKDKIPFKVRLARGEIDVLGTHFNVNAYEDEAAITATLLEGSIRLSKGEEHALLKPGQQAVSARTGGTIRIIPDADVDAAVAWKNGYFEFDGAGIETIMRQLARWYDVEVRYEGPVTKREFGGQMPRGSNLSEVLRILEESKVHFRMEGKILVVMP